MAETTKLIQTNFTSGEISPLLSGRVDWAKYFNGCRSVLNCYVMPHGGLTKRPGSQYIAGVKTSANTTRLVPFEFSTTQAYILEFGHQYMRVFKDRGQVLSGVTPYEITVPHTTSQLWALRYTQSADILYVVHEDVEPQQITRTGHTAWTCTTASFIDGPYGDEVASDITPSAVSGTLKLTAVSDAFASGYVGALLRAKADDAQWYWFEITSFISSTAVSATLRGAAGQETGDLPNTNACNPWRMGAWNSIDGYPSVTTFFEQRLFFAASPNYPQTVWGSSTDDYTNFAPSRTRDDLSYTGTTITQDTIADDDAITYTIAANNVNAIRWMVAAKRLALGTTGGEWQAGASNYTDPITPLDVAIKRDTSYGSAAVQARLINHAVLFVDRHNLKLRELAYKFEIDSFVAPDLTILAEHITRSDSGGSNGIIDMDYQQSPHQIMWCVRADGVLLALTYNRDENVVAWTRHATDGKFESVAVVPGDGTDEVWCVVKRNVNGSDVRYVEVIYPRFETVTHEGFYVDSGLSYDGTTHGITAISQTGSSILVTAGTHGLTANDRVRLEDINGATELNGRMYKVLSATTTQFTVQWSDDITTYTTGGYAKECAQTLTGMDHLNGETVAVLADGSVDEDATVTGTSVTMSRYAARVHTGLPYSVYIKPVRLEWPMRDGTAQGRTKRINRLILRVQNTVGGYAGRDDSHLDRIMEREGGRAHGVPSSLRSGDFPMDFPGDNETNGDIVITHNQPLPFTLLAIMPEVKAGDR